MSVKGWVCASECMREVVSNVQERVILSLLRVHVCKSKCVGANRNECVCVRESARECVCVRIRWRDRWECRVSSIRLKFSIIACFV